MIRRLSEHERATMPVRPVSLVPAARESEAHAPAAPPQLMPALRRLFAEECALAPERIRGLLLRELARFRGAPEVTVRIHPDDLPLLPSAAELSAAFELPEPLCWLADPTLERGGFLLESARGQVDARVATQLARARALLERSAP